MTDISSQDCATLNLYLDGELDVVASLAFEAHAATCDGCKRDLAAFAALGDQLRRDLGRHAADDGLRSRIVAAVAAAAGPPSEAPPSVAARRATRRPLAGSWIAAAAAAAVVAVVSSGATLYVSRPSGEERWVDGIVAAHERALLSGHEIDVASSNRHVVKPWFSGRTSIAPLVVDLGELGYPLLGGRIDVPLREAVPALVYRAGPHVVSVFMRPARGESSPHLAQIDGFSVLTWKQKDFAFYAVSDADGPEIKRFQKTFGAKVAAAD